MRYLLPTPLLALAVAALPLAAQEECPIDIYQPAALAQAGIRVTAATQSTSPSEATKALRDAMRTLQDSRRYQSNLVGGNFLKAQIYVLWLHQEGVTEVMTGDQLYVGGAKTDRVDLLVATDSLLKIVEAVSPACLSETLRWRQSKPWTERIQKAYTFLSAETLDSALYYTDRSALLYASSPFVHNAYAQLASKRNDTPAMLTHLRAAIAAAVNDTSLAETRKQLQFQLASVAQKHAATAPAAEAATLNKEAFDVYVGALREAPGTTDAAYSLQQASEILMVAKDTAGSVALLAPMVAEPAPYLDLTLVLAADVARFFGRSDDAIALYEGALAKNPNIRDANYFLAYLYYEAKKGEPMLPLTDRLISLDPSNADNFVMKALAYERIAAAEKDVKKKQELIKEIQTLSGMESTMPHRLTISRFERRAEGAALEGAVENRGKAAKAYTVQMEFLDLKGEVVESMTAEVAAVKPGQSGTFALTPTKAGIAAFRYQPLK